MSTHRLSQQINYLENEIIFENGEENENLETKISKTSQNENTKNADKKIREKKELPNVTLDYYDYIKYQPDLNKYKIPELKSICKQYKNPISGTKTQLIEKIKSHFEKITYSIIIQKYFRRHIIFSGLKCRGPAFKNRKLCVNESDGYTLEPLDEIPMERFFSYTDAKGFVYGFDIFTLYDTIQKNPNKAINPYTREPLPKEIIKDIQFVFNTVKIVFSYIFSREEKESIFIKKHIEQSQNNRGRSRPRNREVLELGFNYNEPIYFGMHHLLHINLQQKESLDKIIRSRTYDIERRIEDIISEINQLGNYSTSRWILDLNHEKILMFIRILRDIWDYRFGISSAVKKDICPFGDPFSILHLRSLSVFRFDIPQIINLCIDLIYYFICSATDIENRKLGAMYVLTSLTVVSRDARNNMPWLFETIMV